MTPAKQGDWEFNKESLVELRKQLGITQNRMAELLDVPPNTLSRWETGVTVPDAESLAAIYSLAQRKGISVNFFNLRPKFVGISLDVNEQTPNIQSLAQINSLKAYLDSKVEIVGTESQPIVKVTLVNSAPTDQDISKVVFMGIGLSAAVTARNAPLEVSMQNFRVIRNPVSPEVESPTTPWNNDAKIKEFSSVNYRRFNNNWDFPDLTQDEQSHGEVLFPGQCLAFEFNVSPQTLPFLELRISYSISRRHLFHWQQSFTMPRHLIKPDLVNALSDFNRVPIYQPLETVLKLMPKFESKPKYEEVQIFSKSLVESSTLITSLQSELNLLSRKHKYSKFLVLLRAAYIFLDRVNEGSKRMKAAIDSSDADKIAIESNALVGLTTEAAQLNNENLDLMKAFNISIDEANYNTTNV